MLVARVVVVPVVVVPVVVRRGRRGLVVVSRARASCWCVVGLRGHAVSVTDRAACRPGDPRSHYPRGVLRGVSFGGRAPALQAGGGSEILRAHG